MTEHGILLDHERERRLGFDEAIYAAGKSAQQIDAIVAHAVEARQRRLFTRLDRQGEAGISARSPSPR